MRGVAWSEVMQAFRSVDLGLLSLATVWLGLIFLVRAYRWQVLLAPVAWVPVSVFFSATLIGFMGNNVLPLRAGEVLRLYALARLGPVSMSHAVATGTLDRVFDMLLVSLFLGIGLPLIPALEGYRATNMLFPGSGRYAARISLVAGAGRQSELGAEGTAADTAQARRIPGQPSGFAQWSTPLEDPGLLDGDMGRSGDLFLVVAVCLRLFSAA